MFGGSESDTLLGGEGNDQLYGGGGNDVLVAGAGVDLLFGGEGQDHFVFQAVSDSAAGARTRDVIKGFVIGEDKIDIRDLMPNADLVESFTGQAGEITLRNYGHGYVMVTFDTDGDHKGDMQINVLTGGLALSAADFLI